jgi:hypothetical protein
MKMTPLFSLTLSYSSKINGYLYYQRVSPPLKKNALICYQRAMLPQCPYMIQEDYTVYRYS